MADGAARKRGAFMRKPRMRAGSSPHASQKRRQCQGDIAALAYHHAKASRARGGLGRLALLYIQNALERIGRQAARYVVGWPRRRYFRRRIERAASGYRLQSAPRHARSRATPRASSRPIDARVEGASTWLRMTPPLSMMMPLMQPLQLLPVHAGTTREQVGLPLHMTFRRLFSIILAFLGRGCSRLRLHFKQSSASFYERTSQYHENSLSAE